MMVLVVFVRIVADLRYDVDPGPWIRPEAVFNRRPGPFPRPGVDLRLDVGLRLGYRAQRGIWFSYVTPLQSTQHQKMPV